MRIKHLTFHEAEQTAWRASQERWLAASKAAVGLSASWGADRAGDARAVFLWEGDTLRDFMEKDHDRALADAGTVGRHSTLYLDPLEREGTLVDATYVGESVAWVRDEAAWLADRKIWADTTRACDGFRGSVVGRGRHAFLVATFWADGAAHARYVRETVPKVRAKTNDEHTVRLVRFDAALVPELTFGALT